MKKIFSLIIYVLICSLFFGCGNIEKTASNIPQKPMLCVFVPVVTDSIAADDGTIIFNHVQQSISLTAPDAETASGIMLDFVNRVDPDDGAAQSVLQMAKSDYQGQSDWNPYLFQNTYSPTRLDQNILSFFGTHVTYSGTPHPETQYQSVSYDLSTGIPLTIHDILVENVDTSLLAQKVCQALSLQADSLNLYNGYEDTVGDRFEKHLSSDEDWYFTSDGLCFYFAPYELAPYASGVICAQVPYEELTGILSDARFPPEIDSASDVLYARRFSSVYSEDFTQFAEVTLSANGEKILLYTDGSVQDVTIQTGSLSSDGTFEPSCTVFIAANLTPGDAIVLEYDASTIFQISWQSDAGIKSYVFTPEHDLFHASVL